MDHAIRHVLAASALGALLVAVGTLLSGCVVESYGCTAMAGVTGLSLSVLPVTPGAYDIVVRSDVVEAQCPFTLGRDGQTTLGACNTRMGYVGPEFGPSNGGGAVLLLVGDSNAVPRRVEVQVFDANANELVRRTLQPTYTESYPNGRECDVEPSLYAREQIAIAPLGN